MLTQGFQKFYGSITVATKTIFQQRGGACRPVASSLSNLISKIFQKGLDSNFYLHPYLDKFTPHFCVFGCFLSEISRNFTDCTAMSVKPSEVIYNGPWMKLECNGLFTHNPLCKIHPRFHVFDRFLLETLRNFYGLRNDALFDLRNVAKLYGLRKNALFPSGMSRNFINYLTISVKYLEVVKRKSHANKQWSPNEIRV